MRRAVTLVALIALGLVVAPGAAPAQSSQGSGLEIVEKRVWIFEPGTVRVLVAAEPPHDAAIGPKPAAGDFMISLAKGAAPGVSVTRNGDRGAPLTSVILVDESGSYKVGHGDKVARPTIGAYVNAAAGDELALILFAHEATSFPIQTDPAAFITQGLNQLKTRNARGKTSVTQGVRAAIARAIAEGEPGLREVVIFTDAGDEAGIAPDAWPQIIKSAVAGGVRVHAILPDAEKEPADTTSRDWLTTKDGLAQLALETGGIYLRTNDPAEAERKLLDARKELKRWLVVQGKLCGLSAGQPVEVRVDYVPGGQRKAWSASESMPASAYSPGDDAPCPSQCTPECGAWQECLGTTCAARACASDRACPAGGTCVDGRCEQACRETCAPWQECEAGACAAKACTADEVCGAGSRCAGGTCAKPAAAKSDLLVWILAGAGALLLLVALLVLFRKKRPAPAPVVEPAPPPAPEPEPIVEPAPNPLAVPDLDPLPETHLVAIGGWATPGERWRLNQRRTIAGASGDPADGVDVRFAIKQVSGKHAAFELYPSGDLWVSDLGSSNGTFVNGRRLAMKERAKLAVGDQVKLSQQLILVVERPGVKPEERPAEAAPVASAPAADPAAVAKNKKATKFDPGDR